ncbi:MAG: PC4/YdbC family ssDNA-binding protein [Veillonellales bacterium]
MTKEAIKFEIIRRIGVLSVGSRGWQKEVNLISWNGRPAKIDIRDWDENHEKMGKGITLSEEEVSKLTEVLRNLAHPFAGSGGDAKK